MPCIVINSISVLRELYPFGEQISASNSKNAVHVISVATWLLTGCTAPINREGRALPSLETQELSRGREGPGRPLQSPQFSAFVMKKAKSKPFPPSCHNLPASGGLGSRGMMAWRHPSRELRQETISSCQNQSKVSLSCLAWQHLCFISRRLHCRHRRLQAWALQIGD